jgi:hypothetical protein
MSTPSITTAASCHPPRVADRCCHGRLTPARWVPSNSAVVDLAAEPGPAGRTAARVAGERFSSKPTFSAYKRAGATSSPPHTSPASSHCLHRAPTAAATHNHRAAAEGHPRSIRAQGEHGGGIPSTSFPFSPSPRPPPRPEGPPASPHAGWLVGPSPVLDRGRKKGAFCPKPPGPFPFPRQAPPPYSLSLLLSNQTLYHELLTKITLPLYNYTPRLFSKTLTRSKYYS